MRRMFCLLIHSLFAAVFLVVLHTAPASGSSAKVWVGRAEEFEDVLRTGELVSIKPLGEGRNHPRKVTLRKGDIEISGIWKPIERGRHEWAWEHYQAEVVAYQLDQLLGLNMVPPTVVRAIGERNGSLQLWIEGGKLYKEVQDQTPQTSEWHQQISRMRTFDNLICNPDRHPGNFIVDSDWNIILIDHSQCFLSKTGLNEKPEMLPTQFDRQLVEKLKVMGPASLHLHFHRYLMDAQINAILTRRDALLDLIDKLIAEKGEEAVLF